MTGYRLFFLNNGRVRSAEEFEAETDAVAVDEAQRLRGGASAELWCRARVIEEFPAEPRGEATP